VSWKVLKRAFARLLDDCELSPLDRLLLLVLASEARGDDGTSCYPSQQTIARYCGLAITDGDARSVREGLRRLQRSGDLEVLEPARPHRSARYRVIVNHAQTSTESGVKTSTESGVKTSTESGASEATDQIADQHEDQLDQILTPVRPAPGSGEPVRTPVIEPIEPAPLNPVCSPDRTPQETDDEARARFLHVSPEEQERLRVEAIAHFELDSGKYHLTPADRKQRVDEGALVLLKNPRLRPRNASEVPV
jgi:hypothetical protein